MRSTSTALSPEVSVRIVESMAAYLGRLLYAYDFFQIVRDTGMGPDEFDTLMESYEFQPGYLLAYVLDNKLFLEMLKPHVAEMIKKDIGVKPEITWP